MLDISSIAEFSRTNCVSICGFLVPANLLATMTAIALSALGYSSSEIVRVAILGSTFAALMMLHVYTWFSIGVVMPPTYILLCLAITCLLGNLGAVVFNYKYPDLKLKIGNW
ncbi:MAG: hypothetical protein AAF208_10710 [Cyanobacteria bacterium P01_A01_bin.45]